MDKNTDIRDRRIHNGTEERDDLVARLMQFAGPRPPIRADLQARVHDKVQLAWLSSLPRRRANRWAVPLALAASIIVAIALTLRPSDTPLRTIGTVARVVGGTAMTVGQNVHPGDTLRTIAGQGISVSLPAGLSLRIDEKTSLRLDGHNEFTLLSGQVYADSGQQIYRDRHVTIHTATGSVTDIGTQFAVQVVDDDLAVAVREGKVDIAAGQKTHTALAGDKLLLKADEEVVVDQISANDDSWQWAEALAPSFDSKDKSVMDFLKWAARETGKELVFTSDEARMAAMKAKLHGPVSDFTPHEATEAVLSTTTFDYQIDDHQIIIVR
jgi:cytochrome c-type biogenesis protein CcmE